MSVLQHLLTAPQLTLLNHILNYSSQAGPNFLIFTVLRGLKFVHVSVVGFDRDNMFTRQICTSQDSAVNFVCTLVLLITAESRSTIKPDPMCQFMGTVSTNE